jgi:antitoxin CptB
MDTSATNASGNETARRMQWRCRRGMLELDLLFKDFVESHLQENNAIALTDEQVAALDKLLDMPDNDLWNLVISKTASGDPATQQLLTWLRGEHEIVATDQSHANIRIRQYVRDLNRT